MATRTGMIALWIVAALLVLLILRLVALSFFASPPDTLGSTDGHLAPCPRSPNCVSSLAKGRSHSIAPLIVDRSEGEALEEAVRTISGMPGARVIAADGGYLHAEFTSRLFRFVDDLELLWDPDLPGFHVRSASRVGKSDLGANRKRVEALRRLLDEVS